MKAVLVLLDQGGLALCGVSMLSWCCNVGIGLLGVFNMCTYGYGTAADGVFVLLLVIQWFYYSLQVKSMKHQA